MSLSLATADLRARTLREFVRLGARWIEGGPQLAVREDQLVAFDAYREGVIDGALLSVLERLPDGAGADSVWGVIAP